MIKCNLAVIMAERDINISELSKAIKVSRNTLSSLHHNTSKGIQFDTLDKICNYFDISPGELLKHYQFDFWFEENKINSNRVNYDVTVDINNKEITGKANVIIETSKDKSKFKVFIEYEKHLFSALKNVPDIFSRDLDASLLGSTTYLIGIKKDQLLPATVTKYAYENKAERE